MISVLVATYNGEKYIIEQIESIRKQTLPADEVIICDDGSRDKTVELVSSFIEENGLTDWKLTVNGENKGYCKNFLDMVQNARGDIIFLADQDDVWDHEKLSRMSSYMDENPRFNALFCSCNAIDGNGERIKTPKNAGMFFDGDKGTVGFFGPEKFIGRSFIRGCSMCFRSSVVPYLASIELKGLLSHDWLISFTASLTGLCAHFDIPLTDYRCHDSNTSFGERRVGGEGLKKRVDALKNSVDGHRFIYDNADSYKNMTPRLKKKLEKHISFEEKRIAYLENGGFIRLIGLVFSLCRYSCYYGSIFGAVRVILGDIAFSQNSSR